MAFRRIFSKHYTHSNIQFNKVCALWKYTEGWASSRSNGFRKKFFKTLYPFKHTIEQCLRSVNVQWVVGFKQKQWVWGEVFRNIIHTQTYNWTNLRSVEVHWVVGFKQKQWLSGETFQNIINIQTYNWTNYALCESTLTVEIQAEAMASIRNFSKYCTHSNIQVNKFCALWKYRDWWASSRSNGFQTNFFEALYTFKHTI